MWFEHLQQLALPAVLVAVIGYLLGSISFSIIFTRIFMKEDIRSHGSGNAGATNVLRSVGKRAAALTFLFDFLKCVLAVVIGKMGIAYFAQQYGISPIVQQYGAFAAGFGCLLGHVYPVYFGFRGGKGVVTSAAMMAIIDWRVFVLVLVGFIITFAIMKIVSLGSIVGAIIYPISTFLITYFCDYRYQILSGVSGASLSYVITCTVLALMISMMVIFLHRANITRLIHGEEKKLTLKKHTHAKEKEE